jgi:hypothetical protein
MQNQISLVDIVDRINEIEQDGEFLSASQRSEILHTLFQFYSSNTKYLGFDIPSIDFLNGGRLFTGERLYTQLGINTVLSLEICRIMMILDKNQPDIKQILNMVNKRLLSKCYVKDNCITGECAHALLAFWRYLIASDWADRNDRINTMVGLLNTNRDGNGRWNHFPFYYTLMVLQETHTELAKQELDYAQSACEHSLPYVSVQEPYKHRRKHILEGCLNALPVTQMSFLSLGV